jgi:hypothetical protein
MRVLIAAFALVMCIAPACAKDITLVLNDQDQKVLITLLDAALKNGGLANLQSVSQFVMKIQQATAAAAAPPTEEATPPKP